jgi:hypothetical protein
VPARRGDLDLDIHAPLLSDAERRKHGTVLLRKACALVDDQRERVVAVPLAEVLGEGARTLLPAGLLVEAEGEDEGAGGREGRCEETLDGYAGGG